MSGSRNSRRAGRGWRRSGLVIAVAGGCVAAGLVWLVARHVAGLEQHPAGLLGVFAGGFTIGRMLPRLSQRTARFGGVRVSVGSGPGRR